MDLERPFDEKPRHFGIIIIHQSYTCHMQKRMKKGSFCLIIVTLIQHIIQPTRHGPVSAGIWTLMKSQIGTCLSMRPKRGSHVRGTHPSVVWMVWKRLGNICIHKFVAWLNHMLISYIICHWILEGLLQQWILMKFPYIFSSTFSAPSGPSSIAKVCESLSLSPVFVGTSLQRDPSQSLDTNWMWRWVAHVWTWIPSVN